MTRTTKLIRTTVPCSSGETSHHVVMVTLPLAPWEQPQTREDALRQARASGGSIRASYQEAEV